MEFVPKGVKRLTEKGLETDDGPTEEFDIIICATGMTMSVLSSPNAYYSIPVTVPTIPYA